MSLLLGIIIPATPGGSGDQDFITYWAASYLLVRQQNPYDATALAKVQSVLRPGKVIQEKAMPAWNPPWLLLTLAPLTLIPFDLAVRVWIVINISLIVATCYLVWLLFGQNQDRRAFIYILGAWFIFGSTFTLLRLGQVSGLILISLVLIIWLMQKKQYFLVGACMVMLVIKPHLTYLVMPIIFIDALIHRRWAIFIGFITTSLLAMWAAWLFYPGWMNAFFQNLASLPYNSLSLTTLGSFFEETLGIQYFRYIGLLLIPLAVPLAHSTQRLDWLTVINIALVVSLPFSLYGFSFDHVLLLLAVSEVIIWMRMKKFTTTATILIIAGLIVVYGFQFWLYSLPRTYYSWWVWGSVAIMIIYLYSLRASDVCRQKTI